MTGVQTCALPIFVTGSLNNIFDFFKSITENPGLEKIVIADSTDGILEKKISDQDQAKVGDLLERAADDLKNYRLTTPKSNNAYEKYQVILDINSGNELALLGIKKVGNTYLNLARSAKENSDFKRSYMYLAKGRKILGDTDIVKKLEKLIKEKVDDEKSSRVIKTSITKPKNKIIKKDVISLVASVKNIGNDAYAAEHLIASIKLVPGGVNGAELAAVIAAAEISSDAYLFEVIESASIYLVQPITAVDIESVLSTMSNDAYQALAAKALYSASVQSK